MAFDLVSAYATTSDDPFFKVGEASKTLVEAPQQITLRFSPGVKIDQGTLGAISVVRSGPGSDALGNGTDVTLVSGTDYLPLVNDLPNQNEVVIRFTDTLPDDSYRITVGAGLKTIGNDSANPRTVDFRLDLGAFVVSVVPQPVTRTGSTLSQNRNSIDVHFNRDDPLSEISAQNVLSYRLFEVDPATGNDVSPLAPINPTSVAYNSATGKATLTFAPGAIADGKLFRLQIGAAETLVAPSATVAEGSDDNSSFTTARDLGALDSTGKRVDGSIAPPGTFDTPAGPVSFPVQFGSIDEPGHRQENFIPIDSHEHGLPGWATQPDTGPFVGYYNFQSVYGVDGQGNVLQNAITETQKQRAREVFELFSRYTGMQFIESDNFGLTVVTGDVRALNPQIPPTAVAGLGSEMPQMAIMSSLVNWGSSEYGGRYFIVSMHEIGHALGLAHSYDLPSVMGRGLSGEGVYPGDYDTVHLAQLYPAIGSDVDAYKFTLGTSGSFSAQTVIARPGQPVTSTLDSVLSLYRQDPVTGKRELIARNDDYYGRDSFVGLELEPGTYFIAVSAAGNTAFDPEVSDSGYGGRSAGLYRLDLGFEPRSTAATTLSDTTGTLFDGDRDGAPGGAFNFWFNTAASTTDPLTNRTIFVDKASTAVGDGTGTLADPFKEIDRAIEKATAGSIVRIIGNRAGPLGTSLPYLVGTNLGGQALPDGATFNVPKGVTVMIDEDALFKLRAAIVDVGSSSPLVDRSGAAIQVLGTPDRNVIFSSYHDDTVGGDSDNVGPAVTGGQWGGIVLRQDSDSASKKAFVNSIASASIRYGGGQVLVDSSLDSFAPIQLESTRPTIAFNTITDSAGAAIAADPNSFEESNDRIGPEIRGNRLVEVRPDRAAPHQNSINGLFVKIRTNLGQTLDKLDVPARFKSTDIVYVLQENLLINGGVGGYLRDSTTGDVEARRSGRLAIDPGVVVKLQGSRIELERGTSQLIAEGTASQRVVFTSLGDNRFGAGGTFDTNGNLPDVRSAGDWGGIVLNAGAAASIDYAYIAYGGGTTPIEGSFDNFNVIEAHQGDLRVAHSRIESNAAGTATTTRAGRGSNAAATIFVRGAQPVILDNDFRSNSGAVVSINANSLNDLKRPDPGRSTGLVDRDRRYDDNFGPLVRGNRLPYEAVPGSISGLAVRGEEISVESVWDDTDIVHVLQSEIIVQNFHTATGVRLMSRPDASLVVKLLDPDGSGPLVAGFTASGYQLDIEDRIGGTVQVVGQPGYPVVLTSLKDDTVGASIDPLGRFVKDTGNDGATTPTAGDWRSLAFFPYSNDRNVAIVREVENAVTGGVEANAGISTAQSLGVLAPNFASGGNTFDSVQEKSGDENRRLGFEVHGRIAGDDATDVDVYTFFGYAGSDAWIDIDKSTSSLDAMIELLDASGMVRARSADGQTDAALSASTRGIGQPMQKAAVLGGDYYSLNPKDPGMRVVLPSLAGQPIGTLTQYFVRVRSQPRYEPATTGADNGGRTATTQTTYENDLRDAAKVKSGATSGGYELRIRLRQRDEKPGSTVRYADIRYPTVGIDVQGLPRNSQLLGETGETSVANDTFASAQNVGSLLQSDRSAISIAGQTASATDVDWYTFALNQEQIQVIGGVSGGLKTWATVFDLDYGDGFRGDLTISVFTEAGELIYVGRDSDVDSDQPGAGQGNDFDDTSRGSIGKLDPFIGPVHMPTGLPTGGGSIEAGVPITPPNPAAQLRYYVAVSSNKRLPAALDAYFKQTATNSLIRLEPVNSTERIAEDHIYFDGYLSGPEVPPLFPTYVAPSQSLFDLTDGTTLSLHATPFTLSDVTLFVYTDTTIETVDAMRGGSETVLYRLTVPPQNPNGDITMRSDGQLFKYSSGSNAGILSLVNTVSGGTTTVGDDNIPAPAQPGPATNAQETLTAQELGGTRSTFQLANAGLQLATVNGTLRYTDSTGGFQGAPVTYTWSFTSNATGNLTFTNIPTPAPPVGFASPTTGTATQGTWNTNSTATINWSSAIDTTKLQLSIQYTYQTPPAPNPNAVQSNTVDAVAFRRVPGLSTSYQLYYSVRGTADGQSRLYRANATTGDAATGNVGIIAGVGAVAGLAFSNDDTMYGVDTSGNFFRFAAGAADGGPSASVTILNTVAGASFAGLATGPQNLQNGAFANRLFAITTGGTLYCFDTTGALQQVFDSNGDGAADATSIASGATGGGVLGLAFSPLDVNLWHPTVRRGSDEGHGINISLDETRNELDNDKFAIKYDSPADNRKFLMEEGGASMYFGLEKYFKPTGTTATPYLNYQSSDGQLGVMDGQWQKDLTSAAATTMISNNYNLPGGAYGSLITNSFSLANSSYTDKPTLYFNYWLQTEGASGAYDKTDMRDSARVFVSANGGPWELVATNNSTRSEYATNKGELPHFTSVSSAIAQVDNQQVQELYDTGEWRQARVDLGNWHGVANLRLRFDFSTAGEFDPSQRDAAGNKINDIRGYAADTGEFTGDETTKAMTRGAKNDYEGFYIDDVIIGHAERGEMVTGSVAGQTDFYDIFFPAAKKDYLAEQALTGPYQLEIRRGTEYGVQPKKTVSDVAIVGQFDTNDDLVIANGGLGDANQPREQGQFLIEGNTVSNALSYGIRIDAAAREGGTNNAVPGTPQNLPTLNAARLVPGVVVTNNVIAGSGTAGILFSGDSGDGTVPAAAVPYGRIVNNTIYGSATPNGVGVQVTDNAAPSILNNLFANLATGISVDASSVSGGSGDNRTVIGVSAYHNVATQISGGATQTNPLTLASNPFVNASRGNFYLAAGSAAIDSAINTLLDRASFTPVTNAIGIPESPIIAPDRDIYGQLRGDDPSQASFPGLGSNVFKDRGAIDRVDFAQPFAALAVPLDNSTDDQNTAADSVRFVKEPARSITRFELQLNDNGVGIDKPTVVSGAFQLRRNGTLLAAGTDYVFNYLESSNRVVFESPSVYSTGTYLISVVQTTGATPVNVIADLAGNPLLANQPDGTTKFSIELADVPTAPSGLVAVSGDGLAQLSWNASTSDGDPLIRYEVQRGTDETFAGGTIINVPPASLTLSDSPLVNGTPYWFRVRAVNSVGESEWSNISGPVVPLPIPTFSLAVDTGVSPTDGFTSNGLVNVANVLPTATWEFSIDGGGTWTTGIGLTFTLPANATYAAGAVRVRQVVGTSRSGEASNLAAITVDTNPPAAAPITAVIDDAPLFTGPVANGGTTNDAVLVLSGTTDAGTVVEVFNGVTKLGNATVTGTNWSFTTGTLSDGITYAFKTRATDLSGNIGPDSATHSVTVDTTPPAAPTITVVTDDVAPVTGPIPSGGVTNDTVLVLSGTTAAGTTVEIYNGTTKLGNATVTGTGWSFTTGTLVTGTTYLFTARAADSAGNTIASAVHSVTVDTTPPAAPVITAVVDSVPVFQGTVPKGGRTNDNELRIVGTAEPGTTVTVRNGTNVLGSATADGVGNWEFTTTTLADGAYSLTAVAVDPAGNTSGGSQTYGFFVDTTAPAAPVITAVTDNVGSITGNVPNGGRTDDTTLRITGTAEPRSQVTVRSGNTVLRRVFANDFGNWAVVTDPLAVRLHNLNVLARDEAGNSGAASPNHTVTVDTTRPSVLSLGSSTAVGSYGAGSDITIFARTSERMRAGSAIDVTLNTGAIVRLSTATESSQLTGTYRVAPGALASPLSIVSVANVSPIASDVAGNPVAALPSVPFALSGITIDAAIRAAAVGFATDPALAPSIGAAVTSIPIVFTTEVTGVSIADFQLFYNERESISLRTATITGSGRNYTLTIPSSLTNRVGSYRLVIGPSAGIVAVDGGVFMNVATMLYWRRV